MIFKSLINLSLISRQTSVVDFIPTKLATLLNILIEAHEHQQQLNRNECRTLIQSVVINKKKRVRIAPINQSGTDFLVFMIAFHY